MAVQTNAAAVAQRWSNNLASATDKIKAGVQAVTQSPTAKAAANANNYLQGVQRAVSSGKYASALQAVSLQDWQNAMINKGISRVASGATAAMPKMQQFMSQWLPYEAAGVAALASTPRGTIDQNIARAVSMIRYNSQFKYQRTGG